MIYCGTKQYELDRAKTETKKVALPEEKVKADEIRKRIMETS